MPLGISPRGAHDTVAGLFQSHFAKGPSTNGHTGHLVTIRLWARHEFLGTILKAAYGLNSVRASSKDKLPGRRHVATGTF